MTATQHFKVIGISGKAGSGKDYITQHYLRPLGYRQFSLAWHFKIWIAGTGQATYDEVFNTKPPHIRKLLQEEGTERGRNVYGPNVWCDVATAWMQLLSETWGEDKFVFPDIRFPNEVEFIQKLGGKCYRVVAPEREALNKLTPEARLHISETALDGYKGFDGIIHNNPSFTETVRAQVRGLLEEAMINV
jgi:hypothetical protein